MKSPENKEPTSESGAAASADKAEDKDKDKDKDKSKPKIPKPKRPLSGYNYFFRFERAKMLGLDPPVTSLAPGASCSENAGEPKKRRHRKAHGKIGFRDMATIISARWRFLDPNSRAYFESLAAADLQRYTREREVYNAAVGNGDPKRPIKRVKRRSKLMGGTRHMGSFPFPPQHDYEAASRVISPFVRPAGLYGSKAATPFIGGGYSPANLIHLVNSGANAGFVAATAPMPPACISASTSVSSTAAMPPPSLSMNLNGSTSLYPTRNPASGVAQEHQNQHVMINTNAAPTAAAPSAYACIPGVQHGLGTGGSIAPPSQANAVVVPSLDPSSAGVNMAADPQTPTAVAGDVKEDVIGEQQSMVMPEPLLPEQGGMAILGQQQQQIDSHEDCYRNGAIPDDDDIHSEPPSLSNFGVHKRNQQMMGKDGHVHFTIGQQVPTKTASQSGHGQLGQQQRPQQTPRPVDKSKFLSTASGNVDSLLSVLDGDGEGDILDFLSDLTSSMAPAPEGKEEKKDEKQQHQFDKIFDFEQQAAKSTFHSAVSKAMERDDDCSTDEFSPLDFRSLTSPTDESGAGKGGAGRKDDNNDMADLLSFAGIAA